MAVVSGTQATRMLDLWTQLEPETLSAGNDCLQFASPAKDFGALLTTRFHNIAMAYPVLPGIRASVRSAVCFTWRWP